MPSLIDNLINAVTRKKASSDDALVFLFIIALSRDEVNGIITTSSLLEPWR